jgi:hypothetical protein
VTTALTPAQLHRLAFNKTADADALAAKGGPARRKIARRLRAEARALHLAAGELALGQAAAQLTR